jgi:hypothetical protein
MIAVVVLASQVSFLCPGADAVVGVYCEAVHELLHRHRGEVTRIVLIDQTKLGVLGELDEQYAATVLQVTPEAVRNLKAVNLKPGTLPAKLEFEKPHVALPASDAVSAFQPVRSQPPLAGNLLVTLSAISFSGDGQEALVYGSFTCGGMCGQGVIMRLVRSSAGWRVTGALTVWMS